MACMSRMYLLAFCNLFLCAYVLIGFLMSLWQAEVNFLGDLLHPNLVKLIGYCIEDDQRLLVYEFMPRGSLENHLFRRMCIFLNMISNIVLFMHFMLNMRRFN